MMITWHQINFPALDHMEVNADLNPLLLCVYLPVLTSLQRRAEPLWSWYGTVALRGCRLGLLHPRGAPPLLLDIPHSAPTAELRLWKHTHGFAFLLPVGLCNSARRWLSFCPHSLHPQWGSKTLIGPLVGHPAWAFFCDDDHDFVAKAQTSWVSFAVQRILWNHALPFMLQSDEFTSGDYAVLSRIAARFSCLRNDNTTTRLNLRDSLV